MLMILSHPTDKPGGELEGCVYSSSQNSEESCVLIGTVHLAKGELFLVSSQYEDAAKRAIHGGDLFQNSVMGFFCIMIETFHRALALYFMARKTRKGKYRTLANKLRRRIEKWGKAGNPNVAHYIPFLKAEHLALVGKVNEAAKQYQIAISLASTDGHLLHAALSSERYSEFLFQQRIQQQHEARDRLKDSIRFYREWGALGKARSLQARCD